MRSELTSNQRAALECYRRSQSRGVALSAQAREQGLNVRVIYDAVAALRRRGLLPARAGNFVAVRMGPMSPGNEAVCRLRIGATWIECSQWPPAAWLASLAGEADAAPGRD